MAVTIKLTEANLYDDSPWTREELETLATQIAERIAWDAEESLRMERQKQA